MRILVAAVVLLLIQGLAFAGGGRSQPGPTSSQKTVKDAKTTGFTSEREAATLRFVRKHHPELAALLERLRPMNQGEYEQAVVDLFQVSQSLARLKERDPDRFELGLEAWKARSRVELLTAQLASAPSPELESQLRQAVAAQFDVELRQHQFDLAQAKARVEKVQKTIDRLEERHDALIESRVQGLLRKSRNARRAETASRAKKPAEPSKPSRNDRP